MIGITVPKNVTIFIFDLYLIYAGNMVGTETVLENT